MSTDSELQATQRKTRAVEDNAPRLTRRALVGVASGAAAGLAAASAPVAAAARTARTTEISVARPELHALDLIGQIQQEAQTLTSMAYLTHISGIDDGLLFTTHRPPSSSNPRASDESTARFTVFSTTTLRTISTIPQQVIVAQGDGTLGVFFQPQGGAHFATPSSFGAGTKIATFQLVFENILTLTAPGRADVALSADLSQTLARAFTLAGHHDRFGHVGRSAQLALSGQAMLTDATLPRSIHYVAGFVSDSGGTSS